MSVTLDGIDISGLVKDQIFSHTKLQTSRSQTLGGKELIWSQQVDFLNINLKGTADTGWLTRDILQQLYDISSVPGAVYILNYEGAQSTVRFVTEEPNFIMASPTIPRPNQQAIDYYNNIYIQLMEVGS